MRLSPKRPRKTASQKTLSLQEATRYPLFQIPLIALIFCLILALLGGVLGLGRPQVNVAIALDLSGSTYHNQVENIGHPDTILGKEITAVNAYLNTNQQRLKRPNQVQVFGFGGNIQPLTSDFTNDTTTLKNQLDQAIALPNLTYLISTLDPSSTNLDLAISTGTNALSRLPKGCRELLLVTDGEANINPETIANVGLNRVKLNVVLVGDDAPMLRKAAIATGGMYLSGDAQSLDQLFTQRLFTHFNSNLPWVIFWLGCAWIALMWMLCLPLNRLVFQRLMGLNWHKSSQISLANALFWTVVTPCIVWGITGSLPLISAC